MMTAYCSQYPNSPWLYAKINKFQSVGLEFSLEWPDAQVNRSAHALSTSALGGRLQGE